MTVAIIDYGSGNLRSAAKALARAAAESGLDQTIRVTADPEVVRGAARVVLPGVGAFADCRRGLEALSGMMAALDEAVIVRGCPFLGICVGMQLMASVGREHGAHPGFGWIAGSVEALAPARAELKVPHMGWNDLEIAPPIHPVLAGLDGGPGGAGAEVYFVHGYQFLPQDPTRVLARVDYGGSVVAAVGRDNLVGTQFHPEKSQRAGLRLLANFLRWTP